MAKKKISKSKIPEGFRLEHGYILVPAKRERAKAKTKKKAPARRGRTNVPQPK